MEVAAARWVEQLAKGDLLAFVAVSAAGVVSSGRAGLAGAAALAASRRR
jgi:hypothetical protein